MEKLKDKITAHPSYIRGAMGAMDHYRTDLPETIVRLEKRRESLELLRTPSCLTLRDLYVGKVVITRHVRNCSLCEAYIDSHDAIKEYQTPLKSKFLEMIRSAKIWLSSLFSSRT